MRQLAIGILQIAAMVAVWWFASHLLVPYTGIAGTLVWLAGCFALAFWLDDQRWPRGFAVRITIVALGNFLVFFLMLKAFGGWGLLELPLFLFIGYRAADLIDRLAAAPHSLRSSRHIAPRRS